MFIYYFGGGGGGGGGDSFGKYRVGIPAWGLVAFIGYSWIRTEKEFLISPINSRIDRTANT